MFGLNVILAGLLGYRLLIYAETNLNTKRATALIRYQETKKISYLWQASFLPPSHNNLTELRSGLIKKGDCKNIAVIDIMLKNPKTLGYYECLIESGNELSLTELVNLSKNEKSELILFQELVRGSDTPPASEPVTNLGKIHLMIYENNFLAYNVSGKIGAKVSDLSQRYSGKELNMAVARSFFELRLFNLSKIVTKKITADFACLIEAHLLEGSIHSELGNTAGALKAYQKILSCDPINKTALKEIIKIKGEDSAEIELLKRRIEFIQKLEQNP